MKTSDERIASVSVTKRKGKEKQVSAYLGAQQPQGRKRKGIITSGGGHGAIAIVFNMRGWGWSGGGHSTVVVIDVKMRVVWWWSMVPSSSSCWHGHIGIIIVNVRGWGWGGGGYGTVVVMLAWACH